MAVLVAYATGAGSTRGIAERIATRLRQRGIDAAARSVTDPIDICRYEAVVLGSAVYGGTWLPTAAGFVAANVAQFARRPVWLFSVSTVGDDESMFAPWAAATLRRMRRETDQIAGLRTTLGARPSELRRVDLPLGLASGRPSVLPRVRRPLRRPSELAGHRRLDQRHRHHPARRSGTRFSRWHRPRLARESSLRPRAAAL